MNRRGVRENSAGSSWSFRRWRRVARFAPGYLRSVVRHEWQLVLLALGSLAPGVAVLTAWLNLARHLREESVSTLSHAGWLLPEAVLGFAFSPFQHG